MFLTLVIQMAAVVLVTVAIWLWGGVSHWPFLFGGSVAVANSGILAWRWWRGLWIYSSDGRWHLKNFYRSVRERFFVVVFLLSVGFGVGIHVSVFQPLPMLLGFVFGQLVWAVALAVVHID